MKVAVYHGKDNVRIEEVPIPKIGSDEILVEMKACGICGSDLMDWYLEKRAPLVLGHEPAGIVAGKGDKAKGFDIGDRVFVHHHVACLECHYCRHQDYTLCEQFHETNIKPGGFAQFFSVPAPNLRTDTLKIPSNVSFEEATLIEPVGCCIKALRKCGIQKDDSIVIIGAGPTGIIHAALSKVYGAGKVIASDLFKYRLQAAARFGADLTANPQKDDFSKLVMMETGGRGADIAVVTAPSIEAYKTAIKIVRKGGKLCIFAPTAPGSFLEMSPKELFFKEVQVISSYSTSHAETREALNLIASGRLKVEGLITHRFRLEDALKAFRVACDGRESLKVIILGG